MGAHAQLDLDLLAGPTPCRHPDWSPADQTRFVRQEVASHTGEVSLAISLRDDDGEGLPDKVPVTPPQQSLSGAIHVENATALICDDNGMGQSLEDLHDRQCRQSARAFIGRGIIRELGVIRHRGTSSAQSIYLSDSH
jgi:hypothetical protein